MTSALGLLVVLSLQPLNMPCSFHLSLQPISSEQLVALTKRMQLGLITVSVLKLFGPIVVMPITYMIALSFLWGCQKPSRLIMWFPFTRVKESPLTSLLPTDLWPPFLPCLRCLRKWFFYNWLHSWRTGCQSVSSASIQPAAPLRLLPRLTGVGPKQPLQVKWPGWWPSISLQPSTL